MKTITTYLLLILVVALANVRHCVGFTPSSLRVATTERAGAGIVKTSTTLQFGPFSAPKDDGSPGDYVCKVGRWCWTTIDSIRLAYPNLGSNLEKKFVTNSTISLFGSM
jgi:hypothetical protein